MPEFYTTGTLTRGGVRFFIEADSLAEAVQKAERGEFVEADDAGSEMTDWDLSLDVQPNV